ncbi:LLM class flavin-dependent oxidoreductase [Actinomadura decatromicini]|uniref:LLM class flavin-dependent oxidoreductase n=1 Tax=Actinomadura decatromicini TaxID=2604572 RepID=A0A5D3FIE2_9ACTN|nr:LLM class flavin-dependent oxidoreductase [Actinomadura decatromicini]TYK47722.1 LLM class flavin-dependent oxidoreductase [Actinomadura decatromicini]
MGDRRFRFAVMAWGARDGAAWTAQARRAEELGYSTLLTPDTSGSVMPAAALAAAAGATTTLRLGTFVLSAATRPPNVIAWEAASMAFATGDRFELGIGAGRPGGERDAELFGVPHGSPAERLARVEQVIDTVAHPPEGLYAGTGLPPRVLVAGSRPRMLGLAARRADTVAFGVPPLTDDARLRGLVDIVREAAGERFDDLELCTQVHVVGDDVPERMARQMGVDSADLASAKAIAMLSGTPREMADTLARRRDELGVSYVSVSSAFMEEFAPVVELLTGR